MNAVSAKLTNAAILAMNKAVVNQQEDAGCRRQGFLKANGLA